MWVDYTIQNYNTLYIKLTKSEDIKGLFVVPYFLPDQILYIGCVAQEDVFIACHPVLQHYYSNVH